MRESGGISSVLVSMLCSMEWTVSEAGVNLGKVDRRAGSGFKES